MALNFPTSPSTGDVHQASNSLSYFFDGVKWITQGTYDTGTINAIKLDSLTSSFNGSLTTFNLTSNNVAVKPANAQSVQISLGNVIQEPVTAYTINSVQGTITFASAPASNTAFFGIVFSRLPIETTVTNVSDGVITDIKIASNAAIAQSKLNISDATTSASGFMSSTDKTKLDGIESNATADQTDEEIQDIVGAMVSGNTESGITVTYQDSDGTLDFSVASQTDNNFTDADHTKLDGIEASATADQTASEIVALLSGQNITTGVIESTIDSANNTLKIETTTSGDPKVSFNAAGSGGHDIEYIRSSNTLNFKQGGGSVRMSIAADGTVNIVGNLDVGAGIDVTGNIGASGNVTASGFLSSTGGLNTNGDVVIGNDTAKLKLGTSDDLQIYHDGSHSRIVDSGTGHLIIQTSELNLMNAAGNEDMIKATENGSVELYYDGALKAETRSDGFEIKQHLTMGDSDEIRLGNSSDLKIYHNGSNSYIDDNGTGNLEIRTVNGTKVTLQGGTDAMLNAIKDGAVELYHNGSKKLETTIGGVLIANGNISSVPAGNGTASGVSLDTTGGDIFTGRVFIQGDNKSADSDFLTGINNNGSQLVFYDYSNTEHLQKWNKNGSTELNYDGSKKFETSSGGVTVTGTTTSNYLTLSAVNPSITFTDTNDNPDFKLESNSGQFKIIDTTNSADRLIVQSSGAIDVQSNLTAVSSSSVPALTAKGDGSSQDGYIQLNCSQNSHGVKIKAPPHSAAASYTLTLPDTDGSANQVLKTDGNGNLSWVNQSSGGGGSSIGGDTGVDFNDNIKARFGGGNDLEIYHNGTDTYIDNTNGELFIKTTTKFNLRSDGNEAMIVATPNGAVELKYDNNTKLETTSYGALVTGTMSAGSGNFDVADNGKFKAGNSSDLQIYHDGTHSYITNSADVNTFYIQTYGQNAIKCIAQQSVELYENGTKVAETTAGGFNVEGVTYSNGLDMDDNHKILLGTGDDLEIYHNGTHNYLDSSNGHIYLRVNSTENGIKITQNGNVEISYDGSKKFETSSGGVSVTGNVDCDGIRMGDNDEIRLGAGDDLKIYHDGSDSYIDEVGTGSLSIKASGLRLRGLNVDLSSYDNNENMLRAFPNGAVELYYDNTKRLETKSDGARFTGHLYANDNEKIRLGTGHDLEIYHDGSHSYVAHDGTGALRVRGDLVQITDIAGGGGGDSMATFTSGGSVALYYDNSKKFETITSGVTVSGDINLTGELNLTGGSDAQRFFDAAVGTSALTFRGCTSGDANHQEMARFFRGGACELNHAGTKKLETASGGVTVTGLLTATASNLDTGEFGMTTASGTPQARFMDFGFLNHSMNMRRTNGGEAGHTNFLTVASSLTVSGDLNDTSDEKLKKNIASIADGAIAIIKQLRPVTFDWIDENRNNNVSGFIAQEVKTVLPNLVYGTEYDPSLVDETKGSKGGIKSEGYSVNTVGITAHLTKALQEAIAKIEILETKVATLEAA